MAAVNRLKGLREARKLSLHQLASALGTEIAPSTLSRWENGIGEISDEFKFVLAAHFDVSVAHLCGWDRNKRRMEALV